VNGSAKPRMKLFEFVPMLMWTALQVSPFRVLKASKKLMASFQVTGPG
jgi:hypothetical protein